MNQDARLMLRRHHIRGVAESVARFAALVAIALATAVVVATAVTALLPIAPGEFHQIGPDRLT